ncbi:hypothetical protein AMC75_00365 [Staphylococcus carnosus]|uniref:hypothetical protein n=1 Tax=Staphylococcus carnosus TaxID=1281 RepID=UPI0006AB9FE6|nr:hypothetical protein [Staphylococcus carnosus]KOR13357.1 hypothetical protein AMC75_00365 [Staphylococcus carnosus]GEP76445.1 hypothetical protein SCA04_07590 [Staphylococcus carnosus]
MTIAGLDRAKKDKNVAIKEKCVTFNTNKSGMKINANNAEKITIGNTFNNIFFNRPFIILDKRKSTKPINNKGIIIVVKVAVYAFA